jgi:hypothetical protein
MENDDFKSHYVGLSLGEQIQNCYICFIYNEKKVVSACRL